MEDTKSYSTIEEAKRTYYITTENRDYSTEKIQEIQKDAEEILSPLLPALTRFYKKHEASVDFFRGLQHSRMREFRELENGKIEKIDTYEMTIHLFMSRQSIGLVDKIS